MRVRSGVFAVAMVTALVLVAGPATARDRIQSKITIGTGETVGGQEFLKGRVRSPKAKCERNRRVRLFFDGPGPPRTFAPVRDTETDSDGRWRIDAPVDDIPPGRYYAKVRPDERGGDRCKGARSETIRVIGL